MDPTEGKYARRRTNTRGKNFPIPPDGRRERNGRRVTRGRATMWCGTGTPSERRGAEQQRPVVRPRPTVSRLELGAVYHHVGKPEGAGGGRGGGPIALPPPPRRRRRKSGQRTGVLRWLQPLSPPPRAACKLSLFCGPFPPFLLRRFACCRCVES